MMNAKRMGLTVLAAALILPSAFAAESDTLHQVLNKFLTSTHEKSAHQRFWSDDLVYTSSDGTRFGKSTILAAFDEPDGSDSGSQVSYSAEDVDIRLYDDVAIVAFRLVGTPDDGSKLLNYFNTGTFQKRDGQWRAIAWQATIIPAEE